MKKLLLFLSLVSLNSSFFSQSYLDPAFGDDGILAFAIQGGSPINQGKFIKVLANGKILVAGNTAYYSAGNEKIFVARFNSDGSIDNTFGSNGFVTYSTGIYSNLTSMKLKLNGKIVLGVSAKINSKNSYVIYQLNEDGSLDSSFDYDGKLFNSFGLFNSSNLPYISIQEDEKIVFGITYQNENGGNFYSLIQRLNLDGSMDSTFNYDTLSFNNFNFLLYSIAIQRDGKILLGGKTLVRLNVNGSIDSTFGNNGLVNIINWDIMVKDILIQEDDKILISGSDNNYVKLARINLDGTLDNSFSVDGQTYFSMGPYNYNIYGSTILQNDQKILILGATQTNIQSSFQRKFSLWRLNVDGTKDITFGNNGVNYLEYKGDDDVQESAVGGIAIQQDGKILIVGTEYLLVGTEVVVARFDVTVNTGILDFSREKNRLMAYPNPVDKNATLNYTLTQEGLINIDLMDLQGNRIQKIIDSEYQQAGVREIKVTLPETLAPGMYFLVVSYSNGRMAVQIAH